MGESLQPWAERCPAGFSSPALLSPQRPLGLGGASCWRTQDFPLTLKHTGPQVPREFHLAVGKTRRPVEEENAFGGGVECAGLYVAPAGPWSRGVAACQGCRSVSENSPSPAGICSPAKRRLAACLPLPGFLGPSGASGGLPSLCPYETQGGLRMPG